MKCPSSAVRQEKGKFSFLHLLFYSGPWWIGRCPLHRGGQPTLLSLPVPLLISLETSSQTHPGAVLNLDPRASQVDI